MLDPTPAEILKAALATYCERMASANQFDRRIDIASRLFARIVAEHLDAVLAESAALRELVAHCWVHSGYPDCGYRQMTTEQKKLYCRCIGADFDEHREEHFGKAADATGGSK